MAGTSIQLLAVATNERRIRLSRPFKFGMVELRELDHLVVRGEFAITRDGQAVREFGFAGENLVPKWFEKVPGRRPEDDVAALRAAVRSVAEIGRDQPAVPNIFTFSAYVRGLADEQMRTTAALVRQLGVSLIERAALDAGCRATGMPLGELLRSTTCGLPSAWRDALPARAAGHLAVRHTVGLSDDLAALPENLKRTGIRWLKVKLSGDADRDEARVAEALGVPGVERITVDGNENYATPEAWGAAADRLVCWKDRIAWAEQPLSREVALSEEVAPLLRRLPILHVIDESDAGDRDLSMALNLGYAGTTHKNCKGVLKSARALACLREIRTRTLFSGEDLTIITPWSQAQDLAVAATVGVVDVERNGHHYADGLGCDPEVARRACEAFPGLYEQGAAYGARLRIVDGAVDVRGAVRSAFGGEFVPDGEFTPVV